MADQGDNGKVDLRQTIVDKAKCLADNDLYKLFDLPTAAPVADIRTAYFKLAKILHPDSIAREGLGDLEDNAVEVFKGLALAYRVLSDPRRKAEYDAEWARAAGISLTPTQAKTKKEIENEARMFFNKGTLLMKRGAWDDAITPLRKAVELTPRNTEFLCALGWSVMQSGKIPPPRALEEARGWFEQAIHTESPTADAYYYMSMYHKAMGDTSKQRLALQDALTLSPDHVCAQREKRLMNMRARNQKPDLFAAVKKWFAEQTGGTPKKKQK